MAETVKLPKWGLTMEEATIIQWEVEVGDSVAAGDIIAVVESEKVEIDLPSPAAGIVAKFLVDIDDTVPVGTDLMVLAADTAEYESLR